MGSKNGERPFFREELNACDASREELSDDSREVLRNDSRYASREELRDDSGADR